MLSAIRASVPCSSMGGSLWLNNTCGACWYCRRPSLNSCFTTIQHLYQRHTLKKLFTRNWCKSSCTRNLHVCRSIWYQFFLVQVSCTQLSTALFQDRNYLAHDTNHATWLAGELFWCKKLWRTCVKFFVTVSCARFLHKFLLQVSIRCQRITQADCCSFSRWNCWTLFRSTSADQILPSNVKNVFLWWSRFWVCIG